jgi:hypothetical protein
MPSKIRAQDVASTRPATEYFPPRDKNVTPKTPLHTTFKKPRVGGTPNRSEFVQESEDEDKDDAVNFKELD